MCGGCIIGVAKQETAEPLSPGNSAIFFSFTSMSKQDKTAWFAWAGTGSGPCEDENASWAWTQRLGSPEMHGNTLAGLMHATSSSPNLSSAAIIVWQRLPGCCSSPAASGLLYFPWGLSESLWLSKHNHTWSLQQICFSFMWRLT